MITLSVVIPTKNRARQLKQCLRSLFRQSYPKNKWEILVVADGQNDPCRQVIELLIPKYPLIKYFSQSPGGPAKARNLGIRQARGKIICFIDDDCLADKNWLSAIALTFQKNPQALGVEGKILCPAKRLVFFHYAVRNITGGKYWTANMSYRKSALLMVGGFDEAFQFACSEDTDLASTMLKKGQLVFAPQAIVYHPPRVYSLVHDLTRIYYVKNEFRYYLKHKDLFQTMFPNESDQLVFLKIALFNHIVPRFKRIWKSLPEVQHYPWQWLKFVTRYFLEIVFLTLIFPYLIWQTKREPLIGRNLFSGNHP